MNRNLLIGGIIAVVVILIGGIFLASKPPSDSKPQITHKYIWQTPPDLGRTHIGEGENVTYNSNPPTSGPHLPTWEKYGIKDKEIQDELLVHSLEHGYVILSYNCSKLPQGSDCEAFKKQLVDIANEKRVWKLIVIPRSNLDVPLALTAWGHLDKMNQVDKNRIVAFIDEFRDQGPEKTME